MKNKAIVRAESVNDKMASQMSGLYGIVNRFFYGLVNAKQPNFKEGNGKEILIWGLKFYTGLWFFELGIKYYYFLGWLTKYYPFSLLFQGKLFHANNTKLRKLVDSIDKMAGETAIPIYYREWDIENQFTVLYFDSYEPIKNKEQLAKSLERVLQKKFGIIYVRKDGEYFKILVPSELLRKQ